MSLLTQVGIIDLGVTPAVRVLNRIHFVYIGSWSHFSISEDLTEAGAEPCSFMVSITLMVSIIQARTRSENATCLFADVYYTVVFAFLPLQRGIPAVSPDVLNQFPAAPVPTLTGFPMPLPATVSQQPLMPSGPPPVSMPLSIGPAVIGMNITAPAGGAAAQPSGAFMPSYPPSQVRACSVVWQILSWKEN